MTASLAPTELLAILLGPAVIVLAVVFAAPAKFRLSYAGSRVTVLRILVGIIWAGDAALQFLPGATPLTAYYVLVSQALSQPSLSGWFLFWAGSVAANPGLWWYGVGVLEFLLAASLIFGLGRRLAYVGGFAFSIALWITAEGFNGPYDVGTITLGTGLASAFSFLVLWQMDSVSGSGRWTMDALLERKWKGWRVIAGPSPPPSIAVTGTPSAPTPNVPNPTLAAVADPSPADGPQGDARADRRGVAVRAPSTRLLHPGNIQKGETATQDIGAAPEAVVPSFTFLLGALAIVAAFGPRLKGFLSSSSARTAVLRAAFGGMWLALSGLYLFVEFRTVRPSPGVPLRDSPLP